jgi:hypothetical protein
MPQPRPRWNWRLNANGDWQSLTSDDRDRNIRSVEIGSGVTLDSATRNRLLIDTEYAVNAYHSASDERDGPTPGEIKAALERLERKAEALWSTLTRLDDATISVLLRVDGPISDAYRAQQANGISARFVESLRITKALIDSADLAQALIRTEASDSIMNRLTDFAGDPASDPVVPINVLIQLLAKSFEDATGREPKCWARPDGTYDGNFLRYATECAALVGQAERDSLGNTVQEALSAWRSNTGRGRHRQEG